MTENDTSTKSIGELLIRLGLRFGVAESLTGGMVTSELCRIPGISAVLVGGVVAYETRIKRELLGVDESLLETRGAVDPDVAAQMARGVRATLGGGVPLPLGVATTGVAGPDQQDGKPAGTVFIGVSSELGDRSIACDFAFAVDPDAQVESRARIRKLAADAALTALAEEARKIAGQRE